MTDSEITTTILRQIRDQLEKQSEQLAKQTERLDAQVAEQQKTNAKLDAGFDELRDLNRYVRNTQASAILDLRERVTRLEKKVG